VFLPTHPLASPGLHLLQDLGQADGVSAARVVQTFAARFFHGHHFRIFFILSSFPRIPLFLQQQQFLLFLALLSQLPIVVAAAVVVGGGSPVVADTAAGVVVGRAAVAALEVAQQQLDAGRVQVQSAAGSTAVFQGESAFAEHRGRGMDGIVAVAVVVVVAAAAFAVVAVFLLVCVWQERCTQRIPSLSSNIVFVRCIRVNFFKDFFPPLSLNK